ncbi:MAG: Gfo/Idh/MocA family protein [Bacillota bacterium]
MDSHHRPVVIGIAGLGGYAAAARREVLEAMKLPHPPVSLAAVCEPDLSLHGAAAAELRALGIRVFGSLADMLKSAIEAVWLPVPIDLHCSMAQQCLAAGKAVLCEKPPAGAVEDLDAMVAARDRANRPCVVGYQDIYHPSTMLLKRRIFEGQIGRLQSASVVACWPRDQKYFSRTTWAGRMKHRGVWVLDSPANNALSHHINLALFLLGSEPYAWAMPQVVEAELYRARRIENYDTVSMRLLLPGGIPLLVLLTHACMQKIEPIVEITGDSGAIRIRCSSQAEILLNKTSEVIRCDGSRQHMLDRFAKLVRGQSDDRAVATLEGSRAHLAAIDVASEAAPVRDVPAKAVECVNPENGASIYAIVGIEEAFVKCGRERRMLHESGRMPWSCPAGRRELRNYRRFRGPAR